MVVIHAWSLYLVAVARMSIILFITNCLYNNVKQNGLFLRNNARLRGNTLAVKGAAKKKYYEKAYINHCLV